MALYPYSNFHDINLDWIVGKLKRAVFTINGQAPDDDGNVNLSQISGVTTVNGVGADGAGNVQLTPADVNALPDSYSAPVQSVQGKTGNVILSASDVNAMPIGYTAPVQSVNGQTGTVVLDASDVGALPDTYTPPVISVNGQTGTVVLDASDVSALPDTTVVPTATSQLVNDSGFITSQQAGAVLSVNGKVGAVVLDATDVSALPDTTVIPTKTSELINDAGFITSAQAAPVDSVNGYTGAVVLDASDVGAAPAAAGIPNGGTTGQVLYKTSSNPYDVAFDYLTTLLWTNPNPAASFGAQDINVDISAYKFLAIEMCRNNNNDVGVFLCSVGETTEITIAIGYMFHRAVSLTNTAKIVFADCIYSASYGTSPSTQFNTALIPKKIYGIK